MGLAILADGRLPEVAELLAPLGDVATFEGSPIGADLERADVLVVRSVTRVDDELLARAPRLRMVATATSGIDHVDTDALARRGLAFAAAPGANASAVAEYVLAALVGPLGLSRGARIGVVGFGQVGRRVTAAARVLGFRVAACDPPLLEARIRGALSLGSTPFHRLARREPLVSLGDLLPACDAVTVHVPWTGRGRHRTAGLFDGTVLRRMKPGAALVQTSRDGVVDLAAAAAMGLRLVVDVWPGEPYIDTREVTRLGAALVVGTPHVAGGTAASKRRAVAQVGRAIARTFGLEPPARTQRRAVRVVDGRGRGTAACLDAVVGLSAAARTFVAAVAAARGDPLDLEPLRRPLRPELSEVAFRHVPMDVARTIAALRRTLAAFDAPSDAVCRAPSAVHRPLSPSAVRRP
ncbi:MAG: hypothetical protein D6705_17190 [Deltaproteobacteria bacterium]|nr:MAG: hypothetical protein D6705_17190 [Deltaproteobacteria bacterium]